MQSCKVNLISVPRKAARTHAEKVTETTAMTDTDTNKMRLSFLEQENKLCRQRLRSLEKDVQMVLVQLNTITAWISSTFVNANLIDKSSTYYKNWAKTTSQNLTVIVGTSNSFRMEKVCSSQDGPHASSEPSSKPSETSRTLRSRKNRNPITKPVVENHESDSAETADEEMDQSDDDNATNDDNDEDEIDDFEPPNTSEQPEIMNIVKDEPQEGMFQFEDVNSIEGCMSFGEASATQDRTSNGDEPGSKTLHENEDDGEDEEALDHGEDNNGKPSTNPYASHFIIERDPVTNKVVSNKCKHCGLELRYRRLNMQKHVEERCAELQYAKIHPSQGDDGEPVLISGCLWRTDAVWNYFEWRLKKPQNKKEDLRVVNLYPTNKSKKDSKLFALFCKRCHIKIEPRAVRLRDHIQTQCGKPRRKRTYKRITPINKINNGRFRAEIWAHFKWGENRRKGAQNNKSKKKPVMEDEVDDGSLISTTKGPPPPPPQIVEAPPDASISSLKAKNLASYCRHCHKKVCAKVADLVGHLRICKNYEPDAERDWFLNAEQYKPRKYRGQGFQMPQQCGRIIKGSMKLHLKTHERQKTFGCQLYPEWFRGHKSLQEHLKSVHHL